MFGVPEDRDPFFCDRCYFVGYGKACHWGNQTCDCYEGGTGQYCELCREGWTGDWCHIEGNWTNFTEANVTDYFSITEEEPVANNSELMGDETTFYAVGVTTRPPQNETGDVRS